MHHDKFPKQLPSLESALAPRRPAELTELPSLKPAFAEAHPVDLAQLPSLEQALATGSTADPVAERSLPGLGYAATPTDLEFTRDALVRVSTEEMDRIAARLGDMLAAGVGQQEVAATAQQLLEGLGIDASTAKNGFVVVDAQYSDGGHEIRVMNTNPEDFGTLLRRVALHELAGKDSEYAQDQEKMLEQFVEDIDAKTKEIARSIDLDHTEVSASMLGVFEEESSQILNNLYRGNVDSRKMDQFLQMVHNVRSKYLSVEHARSGQIRRLMDAPVEEYMNKANHEFDDDHVGPARREVSVFDNRLQALNTSLKAYTHTATDMEAQLTHLARVIEESQQDRYGQEQHQRTIMSILRTLESKFVDEKTTKIHVKDALEQMGRAV